MLPLPTLLSQALVAFTIEADYEFEQQMPHVTTEKRKVGAFSPGPWLISMPFWSMCLRHVPEAGTTVGEVLHQGFLGDSFLLGTNPGMVRWGYLRLEPGDATSKRPTKTWLVRPSPAGLRAQQTWAPIPDLIESRWKTRWKEVQPLRRALEDLVGSLDHALPDYVPGNASYDSRVSIPSRPPGPASGSDFAALLAKALLQFTIEVEQAAPLAMVHAANIVRVLADGPIARRDLPRATGVGKETLAVMVGILQKSSILTAAAGNAVELTAAGRDGGAATFAAVANVEARWRAGGLRKVLEPLVGDGTMTASPLAVAVEPPNGTWRHDRPVPATLPHHPVVSHRGGYPDGS